MKTTVRLLTPAEISARGFPEMRLFRFGPQSLTSGVLFAFFESLQLLKHRTKADKLKSVVRAELTGDEFQLTSILLQYLLEPTMTEEDKLALWNHDMTLDLVIAGVKKIVGLGECGQEEEALERFCQEFECVYTEELAAWEDERICVNVGTTYDTQAVYYRNYSHSSFVRLPCAHIAFKYWLFSKAQTQFSSRALSESEAGNGLLVCDQCSSDISAWVFSMAVTAAADTSPRSKDVMAIVMRSKAIWKYAQMRCCFCRAEMNTVKWCANNCKICEKCYFTSMFVNSSFDCPLCGAPTQDDKRLNVIKGVLTVSGVTVSREFCTDCILCKEPRDIGEFSAHLEFGHGCAVCNHCIAQGNSNSEVEAGCPSCAYCYLEQERNTLMRKGILPGNYDLETDSNPQFEAIPTAEEALKPADSTTVEQRICPCGEVISLTGPVTPGCNCSCQRCYFSSALLTNELFCQKCSKDYRRCITELQCSNCGKAIEVNGPQWKAVAGFCDCGFVVCSLCVVVKKLTKGKHCVNCGGELKGSIEERDIKRTQQERQFGCYCDRPEHMVKVMECGHKVHEQCFQELHKCRICQQVVHAEKRKTFPRWTDYLQ